MRADRCDRAQDGGCQGPSLELPDPVLVSCGRHRRKSHSPPAELQELCRYINGKPHPYSGGRTAYACLAVKLRLSAGSRSPDQVRKRAETP